MFLNKIKSYFIRIISVISNKIYLIRYTGSDQNIPDIKSVEIEITSQCNLLCNNCDRNCHQAPRNEIFSVNQMKKFVNESLLLHWQWRYIGLIGGEPTLHPHLTELIYVLNKYKKKYPDCKIEIVTNGFGPYVKSVLTKIPGWILIRNSNKKSRINLFEKYNSAPTDKKSNSNISFKKGCPITSNWIGLNKFGYYPCGAGASVDRIFGFNIGIKHLENVSFFRMIRLLEQLCQYCGHFPVNKKMSLSKKQVYSPSWIKALKDYKKNPNQLSLY